MQPDEVIKFLRQRDYRFVRQLDAGASGETVLLEDDLLGEEFACKKFVPYSEAERPALFNGFVRETKILHMVYHENVVRVFTYYLYPDRLIGYILMEYVEGAHIDDYVAAHPEVANELFLQAVAGFSHLERHGVLHRDIRPQNLMVRDDGVLKIIDFGFGKEVATVDDFDKSVSLNLWCEPPSEFKGGRYDFCTEVYFVGKLFEQLVQDLQLTDFKYGGVLQGMCKHLRAHRMSSFEEVEKVLLNEQFTDVDFQYSERRAYLAFANEMSMHVTKIEKSAGYHSDLDKLLQGLENAARTFVLEETVPDCAAVIRLFIKGPYYIRRSGFQTSAVRGFIELMRQSSLAKRRIILSNLQTRLDALPRYDAAFDDDIPF